MASDGARQDRDGSHFREELRMQMKAYEIVHCQTVGVERLKLLEQDPRTPICLNCAYCLGEGFLYIWALYDDGE